MHPYLTFAAALESGLASAPTLASWVASGEPLLTLCGLACLYVALLLFPNERNVLTDRLQDLWIKIDDRARDTVSKSVAFFQVAAKTSNRILARVYGDQTLSAYSFLVTYVFSVLGFTLFNTSFLARLLAPTILRLWVLGALLLAIAILVRRKRRGWSIFFLSCSAVITALYLALLTWTGEGWAILLALIPGIGCGYLLVGLNRKALAAGSESRDLRMALLLFALNALIAAASWFGPQFLYHLQLKSWNQALDHELQVAKNSDAVFATARNRECTGRDPDRLCELIDAEGSLEHAVEAQPAGGAAAEILRYRSELCSKDPQCLDALRAFEAENHRFRPVHNLTLGFGALAWANWHVVIAASLIGLVTFALLTNRVLWPFLSRVVFALNQYKIFRRPKLWAVLGGLLLFASLPEGTLKKLVETILKIFV